MVENVSSCKISGRNRRVFFGAVHTHSACVGLLWNFYSSKGRDISPDLPQPHVFAHSIEVSGRITLIYPSRTTRSVSKTHSSGVAVFFVISVVLMLICIVVFVFGLLARQAVCLPLIDLDDNYLVKVR
jgi:hypothetical protein